MSFIAKNPLSIPEIENSPPPPAEGTRGLFAKEDGWYDIDENGNEKLLTSSAQSASYIICAEDSVNKEGATAIVKRENPFFAIDADGNLLYDENGNQIITNNLQIAFDEIFNREDFKHGSEIVVRRGTYINESLKSYYHLYINRPCIVRFEDTQCYQLGVIHLESHTNNGRAAGRIHLIGAYCNEIDISSAFNIVENCSANSIIVSNRLNTVINNYTSNIYLTGTDEEFYAKQCRFWGNTSMVRSIKSDYIQADGFVDAEGDIYTVNDIECNAYIRSLIPVKSISANGTPLEPDADKNVDIPLAIPPLKVEAASVEGDTSAASGARAPIITPPPNYNPMGKDGLMSAEDKAKLDDIADGAQVNVQSDWNQTDDTEDDYIKNKPNNLATETYVNEKIATMVDSAPETLDTLNELAQALGDDPNFATTVATQIGQKVDKEEGKGLSSNDFTDDYQSKVDTAVQSISANGTQLAPDENKNVDIPVVNEYNPGLVRVMGTDWGIQFLQMSVGNAEYDGCLTVAAATQDDIDKRINSYKPITPATLQYAVESITNPVTLGTNEVIEDNSITINLLNNKKYILTQDTTYSNMTIEYTFDSSDPSIALNGFYEFNAGLIFKTPSDIDCNFIYPSSFYFISDDAEDGVFAPQKNMVYEIMFSVEAKTGEKPYYIARVSGYEAPTNEVV